MLKNGPQGSLKSGSQMFGSSSPVNPQDTPLLDKPQVPGISLQGQDSSFTSLASASTYEPQPSSLTTTYSRSGHHTSGFTPMHSSPTSPVRYGPTATMSTPPSQRSSPTFAQYATKEHEPLRGPTNGAPVIGGIIIDEDGLEDSIHTFTEDDKKELKTPFAWNSTRGWANGVTLFVLMAGFVVLFAGYPIIQWANDNQYSSGSKTAGYNMGGVNASGQYPDIPNFPQLIDPDTPKDAYSRTGRDGKKWDLVFSDEFEKDGRTFYPGDDPFFTAVDIHYWPTNDFEWYDPGQVTTKDGHLVLTLAQIPLNNLMFRSGMLQSWNQLCFNKNAYFEASVSLPGRPRIGGFWPGIWTMGNLGRPGYGASTDGLWPYSYSSCDVGIMPNQTSLDGTTPANALNGGVNENAPDGHGAISYLPGQRLSSCNCDSSTHPGPEGVGRGAVEIDMLEAQTDQTRGVGTVSQSAQVAPFDYRYMWDNTSTGATTFDLSKTIFNTYRGGVYQQAASALTDTCEDCTSNPAEYYLEGNAKFAVYGFEYVSNTKDPGDAYVEWVTLGKPSWRMDAAAVGPNSLVDIGQRLVSEEPMALIFNLGMSNNFETVDFSHLKFPAQMHVDYIRVYQLPNSDASVGCDPDDRPTAAYIAKYPEVYNNPNLTTWTGAGYTFPGNKMNGGC